jgi:hypothetical protein
LSVTCGRSVVFLMYSGFLRQWKWPPRYSWNGVESGVKHHSPYPFFDRRLLITSLLSSNFSWNIQQKCMPVLNCFSQLKVVPYTSGKIWSARLIFLFFGSMFEYIHCNTYQNFNKFQPTNSLCGFDHRDAWNLHTNIIWSKHSTDFKELSSCSVRYPLKNSVTLQVWNWTL